MKISIVFSLFLLLIVLVLWSVCINPFAPKLGDISSNLDIFLTPQKTPEEVMTNFRYAYILKDSLIYRNLLSDDFIFVWRDHENDTFVSWGKEVDIRKTVGMFNFFTVINLVWNSTNYITYSPDSTTAEISKGFVLTLDSELRITGEALFNLMKLQESGIWKITRWVDKSII